MKTRETISNILKNLRKNIKPATGLLTSIDPKKMAKVAEEVKIAKEVEKTIQKKEKEDNKK